jgi:hypothetical protein
VICAGEAANHEREENSYANVDDFCVVFHSNLDELHQLSLLLTADPEKAERCVVAGFENCVKSNNVFRDWARSWAKRAIVQNAIRALEPRFQSSSSRETVVRSSDNGTKSEGPTDLSHVLALPDFERFVFVMSVLEDCSERDCALLLSCTVREIGEARVQALERIARTQSNSFSDARIHVLKESK